MKGNDKKGRSGRTKFSETDKRILQGQAVKEGDVETKPGKKKETDSRTSERAKQEAWRMQECVDEQSANGGYMELNCV